MAFELNLETEDWTFSPKSVQGRGKPKTRATRERAFTPANTLLCEPPRATLRIANLVQVGGGLGQFAL